MSSGTWKTQSHLFGFEDLGVPDTPPNSHCTRTVRKEGKFA